MAQNPKECKIPEGCSIIPLDEPCKSVCRLAKYILNNATSQELRSTYKLPYSIINKILERRKKVFTISLYDIKRRLDKKEWRQLIRTLNRN